MKVLKLIFLVTNFILQYFYGDFFDHGNERSVSMNLDTQALYGVRILCFSNYGEGCGRTCIGLTIYQL